VAARHLAPGGETAGVIGTGVQARLQMQAAHLVRPFREAAGLGARCRQGAACADDLEKTLGIMVEPVNDPETLVRESQLVVTTTPARAPIVKAEWLHPGLHITAMGSDQEGKNEIASEALAKATLYVADRASQVEGSGELRSAIEGGLWTGGKPVELGEVITGKVPGRQSAADITIADLTGTGAQDTAIASHVAAKLAGGTAGTVIST
jgi:ornithine cyclodeaminase/alanine dehydrogenase-like protein (mu-crystallin family)